MMNKPLLTVKDLSIGFGNDTPVVDRVSFSVHRGETLALVGESGSGKTISCRSVLRILPAAAQIRSGSIILNTRTEHHSRGTNGHNGDNTDGIDILTASNRQLRSVRGNAVSMIFQEPMRSLSPLHTIGNQVSEVLWLHKGLRERNARKQVLDMFERVGFPNPERAYKSYPFELSGGMRQRAMIAMAMISEPDLLIADEPTTALDVTTQAQVLGLIYDLQQDTGMGLVLVTHDLGVVANMAEQVVVMHKGRVMEAGRAEHVLRTPAHAYTKKLFDAAPSIPDFVGAHDTFETQDLILQLKDVNKTFKLKSSSKWKADQTIHAARGIDLNLPRGKTLAIVGESGSGKTTAARIALGADRPDAGGEVWFSSHSCQAPIAVHDMARSTKIAFQRQAQMVFQDPYSSLSPRMRIVDTLVEPMEIHRIGTSTEREAKAARHVRQVGLNPDMLKRYPHAFSGGQRQRLSIARALMLDPSLLVLDEPTSALDVSVQDQVLDLLEHIREDLNLSYLFISHDLAVVARVADEVAVMRQGLVVEQGPPDVLFHNPQHPYTRALIAAQPVPDIDKPVDLKIVAAGAGSPDSWPEKFRFTNESTPALIQVEPGHKVRCHV
jgi:peptide/nickel transport system ATP-binding protein